MSVTRKAGLEQKTVATPSAGGGAEKAPEQETAEYLLSDFPRRSDGAASPSVTSAPSAPAPSTRPVGSVNSRRRRSERDPRYMAAERPIPPLPLRAMPLGIQVAARMGAPVGESANPSALADLVEKFLENGRRAATAADKAVADAERELERDRGTAPSIHAACGGSVNDRGVCLRCGTVLP